MKDFTEIAYRQMALPMTAPACPACPYRLKGRCEGPITIESFTRRDESVIGCYDATRIKAYHKELARDSVAKMKRAPQSRHELLRLPSFIPMIKDGLSLRAEHKSEALYGVSLGTLLKDCGDLRFDSPEKLRRSLGLDDRSRLALIGTAADWKIERFWKVSESRQVWQRIALLQFEFVTSATFSVWSEQPRSDQIYNQDRNFFTHDYLCALGIPSVPFIFFYTGRELDYRNVINWLKGRPDLRKVAILAQLRRSKVTFEKVLEYMRSIGGDIGRPLDFIVVGVATAEKIDRILQEFKSATIVTDQPFMKAMRCGEQTLRDLSHVKNAEESRERLAIQNIERFHDYCHDRAQIYKHLPGPALLSRAQNTC
jgi:hypothetical protein